MIPILFDSTETLFDTNGVCRLSDSISCLVTEERNGIYECDFEYPVDGAYFDEIRCGRIIACTHEDSVDVQPFDIVGYSRPINGVVKFHATHISYRQKEIVARGSSISTLSAAFDMLKSSASPSNPFKYETDLASSTINMGAADGIPRTVRQLLGGVEGSILDTWGGEYQWDKWTVRLLNNRGNEKDFAIRYGVNMIDYNEDIDYSETYSAVFPFWSSGEDDDRTIVLGGRVDSGMETYSGRNICVPLDLSDKFETAPTASDLRDFASAYMRTKQVNLPKQNISVDFIRLQDSEEFSQYAELLQCKLCDYIPVIFPWYGVQGRYKIVKTVYNVLTDRYESMELGDLSMSLSEALGLN